VVQGKGPEFKPQYCKKEKEKKERKLKQSKETPLSFQEET
jgi:hypothetical protein